MNFLLCSLAFYYESPWPFLVSTASLFLTLGAVLFFFILIKKFHRLKIFIIFFGYFFMLSSGGIFGRISTSLVSILVPVVGSSIGIRAYTVYNNSSRQNLYNDVSWTPSLYDRNTRAQINDLVDSLNRKDEDAINENCWQLMTQSNDPNYGKTMILVNMLCDSYNKQAKIPLIQSNFFDYHGIPYVSTELITTPSNNFFQNVRESSALILVNTYNPDYKVLPNLTNSYLNTPNVGLQSNTDFIVTLNLNRKTGEIRTCYVDCKHWSQESTHLTMQKLYGKDFSVEIVPNSKFVFGCNIYIIGNLEEGSSFLVNDKEKEVLIRFLDFMSKVNPEYYKDFFDSEEFKFFERTGNLSTFKDSKYPVMKVFNAREDFRRIKPLIEYESIVDRMKTSVSTDKPLLPPLINITFDD